MIQTPNQIIGQLASALDSGPKQGAEELHGRLIDAIRIPQRHLSEFVPSKAKVAAETTAAMSLDLSKV